MCHNLGIPSVTLFRNACITFQNKWNCQTTMAIPFAIVKLVAFHLPYNYTVLFNTPEQNRTYTTPVPSAVLIM